MQFTIASSQFDRQLAYAVFRLTLGINILAHGIARIVTLNGADFTRYPGVIALHPTAVP